MIYWKRVPKFFVLVFVYLLIGITLHEWFHYVANQMFGGYGSIEGFTFYASKLGIPWLTALSGGVGSAMILGVLLYWARDLPSKAALGINCLVQLGYGLYEFFMEVRL